jgi:probable biosynthetic protein (TIGR04099 family)
MQSARHLLGMPMLNAAGLSEAWLQKTCGEAHWLALSRALKHPPERWLDRQGRRVYAAFFSVELQHARLEFAQEGLRLQIDSELRWLGASQAWSRHRLDIDGRSLGVVDMLSAFVSRHQPGSNASVRRAEMPPGAIDAPDPEASMRCAALRARRQAVLADHRMPGSDLQRQWTVTPCPRHDFNGAGLLYFPSFSALADRALWRWGLWPHDLVLRHRECTFTGNVDVGESVRLSLLSDTRLEFEARALRVMLNSASDGRCLAAVGVELGKPG